MTDLIANVMRRHCIELRLVSRSQSSLDYVEVSHPAFKFRVSVCDCYMQTRITGYFHLTNDDSLLEMAMSTTPLHATPLHALP